MRPVKLVMEGFGAYRDRTEVDFDGVDLFALTGPTGAGKSTVVDAICMALYGSIPRYDNKALIAPAISQGLNDATVYLDFLVEGVPYTAVRVIRRTQSGGANTKEARLERNGEVIASGGPELTDRIVELLGLSFEHFTRCVVLPQGQFAKFLHDRPKDRQELLKNLLDITVYERVASAARDRAKNAKARTVAANERLAELASATPERRTALAERAAMLDALYHTVRDEEDALRAQVSEAASLRNHATALDAGAARLRAVALPPEVGELASSVARNRESLHAVELEMTEGAALFAAREQQLAELGDLGELRLARQAHEQLDELAHATPDRRADVVALVGALESLHGELRANETTTAALETDAAAARRDAIAALATSSKLSQLAVPADVVDVSDQLATVTAQLADTEAATHAADALVAERQSALDALGDVASLASARRTLDRLVALHAQQHELATQQVAAQTALDAAHGAEESARAAHEIARGALDDATVAHQAHALRPHLVVGEACPVCEHVIATLPKGKVASAIAKAQSAETSAAKQLKKAEGASATASANLQGIAIKLALLTEQITDIDAGRDRAQSIESIDAQLAAVTDATESLAVAKTARSSFESQTTKLRADEKALRAREAKARTALLNAVAEVATLGAPAMTEDIRADWVALVAWAASESEVHATEAAARVAHAERVEVDVERRRASGRTRAAERGVVAAADQDPSEAIYGAARSAEAELKRLDDALMRIERLRETLRVFASHHPTGDSSRTAIDEQLAAAARATSALDDVRSQLIESGRRVQILRDERTALADSEAAARQALSRLHIDLAGLGAPLPDGRDVQADWLALLDWAQAEAPVQAELASVTAARIEEADQERDRRQRALLALCEQADVHPKRNQPAAEAVSTAAGRAADDVARVDEELAKVSELRASVTALAGEAAVADELARLLRADNFEKWLLDDVMTQLVEGATIRLLELSGDQFSLAYDDGDFMVIDHKNADQQRQAKTLSGGETFLASLSLALSLADQLATFATGKTVTLDALFLDEGFGTLDADTL
ncbi:MAG: SMC family ATPase, partial [Acidimicrobiales bacterium]